MNELNIGPDPCTVTCPHCNQQVTTEIEPKATTKTHLFALILCLFGCCCCACALYCTDCLRGKEHRCPQCKAYIGLYDK